ncbi:hypothetical protein I4F81_008752 [Pyropia yezoensis]|uniref:Uncharacterized protein n=1 Tax=Pyropia yezoensis TaxID=2788 RepID=A0ACC3C8V6_PYRYE|nr:hypothetical protein I4F81_008752 [Neopyropia yezoensis]
MAVASASAAPAPALAGPRLGRPAGPAARRWRQCRRRLRLALERRAHLCWLSAAGSSRRPTKRRSRLHNSLRAMLYCACRPLLQLPLLSLRVQALWRSAALRPFVCLRMLWSRLGACETSSWPPGGWATSMRLPPAAPSTVSRWWGGGGGMWTPWTSTVLAWLGLWSCRCVGRAGGSSTVPVPGQNSLCHCRSMASFSTAVRGGH